MRESGLRLQRYKLANSVMGPGRAVSGWAAHTQIFPLNHGELARASRSLVKIQGGGGRGEKRATPGPAGLRNKKISL